MSDFFNEVNADHLPKSGLRAALLARRRNLSAGQLAAAAARIQDELDRLVREITPQRIASYIPIGAEPGGSDLPERLAAAAGGPDRLLLPVTMADRDLDWARYAGPASLAPAGWGTRAPAGPRLGVDALTTADLVVVPAVAVDRQGVRLGRGGGSYDRALRRVAPGSLIVALLHEGEWVAAVPAEPHDQRVAAVITPAGRYHLPAR